MQDLMLARIEAVAPDVVIMDDLNYAETTALAVMLVEKGIAVFATMRGHEKAPSIYYLERRLEEVEEIGAFDNAENLVKGLIKISRNPDSTVHRLDGKTKYIARVETPEDDTL